MSQSHGREEVFGLFRLANTIVRKTLDICRGPTQAQAIYHRGAQILTQPGESEKGQSLVPDTTQIYETFESTQIVYKHEG